MTGVQTCALPISSRGGARNPFSTPVQNRTVIALIFAKLMSIPTNVDTAIVDGRVRLRGGQPVGFDGAGMVTAAQQVSAELWERIGGRKSVAHGGAIPRP